MPWLGSHCRRCGQAFPGELLRDGCCGGCIGKRFAVDSCHALFSYSSPIRELIAALKYRQRLDIGFGLGQVLAAAMAHEATDLLLPVPMSGRRFRQRGYNQSWELTRTVARQLSIPANNKILAKLRHTPAQSSLASAAARKQNLRGAFAVTDADALQGLRCVTLIDDVTTTMATVTGLARALKRHGVGRVQVWCLARA